MSSFRGIVGLATVIIAILLFGFLVMVGWRAVSSPQALLNDVLSMDSPADPDETEQKVFITARRDCRKIAERLKSEGDLGSLLFRLRIEIEEVAGDLSAESTSYLQA